MLMSSFRQIVDVTFGPEGVQRIPRPIETTSVADIPDKEVDTGVDQIPQHDDIQESPAPIVQLTEIPQSQHQFGLTGSDLNPEHERSLFAVDEGSQWGEDLSVEEPNQGVTQNERHLLQSWVTVATQENSHCREGRLGHRLADSNTNISMSPTGPATTSFAASPHIGSGSMTITSHGLSPIVLGASADRPIGRYTANSLGNTSQELQYQPHDHTYESPKYKATTWLGIPELEASNLHWTFAPCTPGEPNANGRPLASSRASEDHVPFVLSQERSVELWQNYLDEVAPWLDILDNDNHWRTSVAYMARQTECLHYSLLALSARQQERRRGLASYTESLKLYQQAIRLITVQLPTVSTEVIAACILLCVLEMMGSSPNVWTKHLGGCVMLLEAAGVTAEEGGVRQALFLTVARMDVYRAFIGDTMTKTLTYRWFVSQDSMSAALAQFKGRRRCDYYANYMVVLNAAVVNLLADKTSTRSRFEPDSQSFVSRWTTLYDLVEEWYDDRPEVMRPLMTTRRQNQPAGEDFDTILFSTSPAICGNALYHVAVIFLLQDKPKDAHRSHASILWHARQICGIVLSNNDDGSRIHSLQPILTAGKAMSHHSEHQAILCLLRRLEADTGWATVWCQEDLQEHWGLPNGGDS